MPLAVFGLGGAAVLIAAALVIRRGPSSSPNEDPGRFAAPDPTAVVPAVVVPPTEAARIPIVPTEAAVVPEIPTSPPATPPVESTGRVRRPAEDARASARTARSAAERAKAPEVASALYESARRKEREGQRSLEAGRYDTALTSFESATALFRQAESWSRSAPVRPAERVAVIPPTREPVPEPPRPVPTAAIAPPEPRPAPAKPTEPKTRSEEERVREAVALYVEAQNSLDVGLYARAYPGLAGTRRRMVEEAFANLKSQTLELDIQRIEITGSRAQVVGYERRLAVPRIGSEQRDARQRIIHLERRGDGWVITELR